MGSRRPYTFRVLRYVHDVLTGERMNVGLAYVAEGEPARLLVLADASPIKAAFPSMDSGLLERDLATLAGQPERDFPDVVSYSGYLLVEDDSSLQWGTVGSGIRQGAGVAEDLFRRMVPAAART